MNLSKAKNTVRFFNIISAGVMLVLFFFPEYIEFSLVLALLIPISCLVLIFLYPKLFCIAGEHDERRTKDPYELGKALTLPLLGVVVSAFRLGFELNYGLVWLYTLVLLPTTLFLFHKATHGQHQEKHWKGKVVMNGIFSFVIGPAIFCFVILFNCVFSNSEYENIEPSEVLEQKVKSSKNRKNYYLFLKSKYNGEVEFKVSKSTYETIEDGTNLDVYILEHKGLLFIPWYRIRIESYENN